MIKIASGTSVRLLGQLGVDLAGLGVSFAFEQVNPMAADSSGYVIGLGGSQTQTRAATVLGDPTAGLAAYTLTSRTRWRRVSTGRSSRSPLDWLRGRHRAVFSGDGLDLV